MKSNWYLQLSSCQISGKRLMILLLIFVPFMLQGNPVDTSTVKTIARNFFWERTGKSINYVSINPWISIVESYNDTIIFYVVNINNNGHVIISADDNAYPILCYSLEQNYSFENQSPAYKEWMNDYREQIMDIIRNQYNQSIVNQSEWIYYSDTGNMNAALLAVSPLVSTTWNQGCYYNQLCPYDTTASPCDHVYVGCVAVAMAQVMKYWNLPLQGTGSHSYYHSTYGTLSANFGSTTYDWTNMPNSLSSSSTTTQKTAVATLLYHCGVSVDMDYGPTGSGAYTSDVETALKTYFGYHSDADYLNKSSYTTAQWDNLLKTNLDNGWPIVYRGRDVSLNAGHAFVLDGYQGTNNDHYHFNWGWGGSNDGYFYLTNLNPSTYNFSSNQAGVVNIHPPVSGPCTGITSIGGCGSGYSQTYSGGGSGSWYTSTSNPCGYASPGIEKIFSFVAPVTGIYSIQVTAASGYVDYLWKAASCTSSGWTCIDDITSTGSYGSMTWSAGQTYYILLDDENSTTGTHTFYINCPANVINCSGAYTLTCGTAYNSTTVGSNSNVSQYSCSGWNESGPEKVHTITINNSGTLTAALTNLSVDLDVFILSYCDEDSCVAYGDNTATLSNATAGTYYIVVDGYNGASGSYTLTVTCPAITNPCTNILSIGGCGSAYSQTYIGGGAGLWYTSTANPCYYTSPGIENIYSFVAPITGTYSIEVTTASGGYYVDYLWKSGSCSSSGWNCITDVGSTGTYGSMSWTAGLTYYILLDDEDANTGTHVFYINCPTLPDPCNSITSIGGCGSSYSQTFTGGGSGSWYSSTFNPCGYISQGVEKIYSFVAPATGTYSIQVTTASGGYYVDYLWKTGSCSSSGWNCIDDVSVPGNYGSMSWTAGITYYILLDDEDTNTSSHTFYINCPASTLNCTMVYSLACGSAYNGTTIGGNSNAYSYSCSGWTESGPEKVHTVIVNNSGTLTATLSNLGSNDLDVFILNDCDVDSCVAYGNYTATYYNATAGIYYIVVDGYHGDSGSYTLTVTCPLPPDPCNNIISINGCGPNYLQSYTSGGTGLWNSTSANPCTYTSPGLEKIYSFVAPVTGTYSIQVTSVSGGYYVDYLWKTGSCSSSGWNCIADVNSTGSYGSMSWTAGLTYYILLDDEDINPSSHTFYVNCPANALNCAGAYALTCGTAYNGTTIGGNSYANLYSCSGWNETGPEKVHTITTTFGGTLTATLSNLSSNDLDLFILNHCHVDSCVTYGDYTATYYNATPGTYYVVVDGYYGDSGSYTLTVTCPTPPDPCNSITTINGCGANYSQTFTSGGSGSWYTSTSNPCGYISPGLEKIYSFVAPITGAYSIQVTTASGGYYVDYLWKTGSCSSSGWNCIYDVGYAGTYGFMVWTAGLTYYILLDDEDTNSNSHTFYINCPVPLSVTATSTPDTICSGSSVQLNALPTGGSGNYTYTWSSNPTGFNSSLSNPMASPAVTTTYYVTVNDSYNNTSTDVVTVTVNSLPVANAGSDVSICFGNSTILTASGGTNYAWSNNATSASTTVSPTSTTTYTVTVTDNNGCTDSDDVIVTVNQLPAVNFNSLTDVCINSPSFVLTGATPPGGVYSGNAVSGGIFNPLSAGAGLHIITYTYTDQNQCTDSDTDTITVNLLPNVSLSNYMNAYCLDDPADTLIGMPPGGVYIGPFIHDSIFDPSVADTGMHIIKYIYQDINTACSDTVYDTIYVYPLPVADAGSDVSICEGACTTLQGSGGLSYNWSNGATTDTTTVCPLITTTYILTVTDAHSCQNIDMVKITVDPKPFVFLGNDTTICIYHSLMLNADNTGSDFLWSTGDTTQTITVDSTTGAGSYWVMVTNQYGCVGNDTIVITFDPCLGTNDYNNDIIITIFPNPSSGEIYIKINNAKGENLQLKILDQLGQSFRSFGHVFISSDSHQEKIDMTNTAPGVYFLIIELRERSIWRKVIISR